MYILEDLVTREKTAAKTLREEFLSDNSLVKRFRREMKIWVGIGSHPNVVRAFQVRDIYSTPFLLMEYMDGGSLAGLLQNSSEVPDTEIIRIGRSIAEGMRFVHSRITQDGLRGIVHRDLKPANILLDRTGSVKVADFGLARATNTTQLTKTYDVVGTIQYSSPEQIVDSRHVDRRTDVYSFGAVLYHISCGVPPFRGRSWSELIKKITDDIPPEPASLRKNFDTSLSAIIMKCLSKKKEERYEDFTGIISDFDAAESRATNACPGRSATAEIDAACKLAEEEAMRDNSPSVEPVHLLRAALIIFPEPISTWVREARIERDSLIQCLRSQKPETLARNYTDKVVFSRPARRIIGIAREMTERDFNRASQSIHLLRAIFGEESVRVVMTDALNSYDSKCPPNGEGSAKLERLMQLLCVDMR